MPRLQRKSFATPDQVRQFPTGRCDIVTLDEMSVGRFVFQPGWRWSKDVKPVAGTSSCQFRHLGYTVSGALEVLMNDGTTMTIRAGEAYEIPPGHDAWVVGDEPWDSVEFSSGFAFGRSPEELGERVLATILFSDIVGATERAGALGDSEWGATVGVHFAVIDDAVSGCRGRVVKSTGDGVLATFDGPARAVRCGRAIIDAVQPLGLDVRAGVHTGEVEVINGKVGGLAVNIGARVAGLADSRELLVSSTVKDLTAGSGLVFEDAGVHELKGIPEQWHLYRVLDAGS